MNLPRYEVVTTSGGMRAIYDRGAGEVMHPVVGPAVEAEALYVAPARLRERLAEPSASVLSVLDVGLGAASNAIAAWKASEAAPATSRRLRIMSFDHTLEALHLALAPEHARDFGLIGSAGQAARTLVQKGVVHTDRTEWKLCLGELPETLNEQPSSSADIVFWDPYSPMTNPTLWTTQTFRLLRTLCRDGATVHTYSSATPVRSALLLAGFDVGAGPSIGTKAETTMAAVGLDYVACPLGTRWLQRFHRSSAPLPRDAEPDAMQKVTRAPQFCVIAGDVSSR